MERQHLSILCIVLSILYIPHAHTSDWLKDCWNSITEWKRKRKNAQIETQLTEIEQELRLRQIPVEKITRLPVDKISTREYARRGNHMLRELVEALQYNVPENNGGTSQAPQESHQSMQELNIHVNTGQHNALEKHDTHHKHPCDRIITWLRQKLFYDIPLHNTIGYPTLEEARMYLDTLSDWLCALRVFVDKNEHIEQAQMHIRSAKASISAINPNNGYDLPHQESGMPWSVIIRRWHNSIYRNSFNTLTFPRIGVALATGALASYFSYTSSHPCMISGTCALTAPLAYAYLCEPRTVA